MYTLAIILGASTDVSAFIIAAVIVFAFRMASRKAWLVFPAILVVTVVMTFIMEALGGRSAPWLRFAVSAIHVGLLYAVFALVAKAKIARTNSARSTNG